VILPKVLVKGLRRRPRREGGNVDEAAMCRSGIQSDEGHGRGATMKLTVMKGDGAEPLTASSESPSS
jgi:hypothetical protein